MTIKVECCEMEYVLNTIEGQVYVDGYRMNRCLESVNDSYIVICISCGCPVMTVESENQNHAKELQ